MIQTALEEQAGVFRTPLLIQEGPARERRGWLQAGAAGGAGYRHGWFAAGYPPRPLLK